MDDSAKTLNLVIACLAFIGLLISAYLTYSYYFDQQLVCFESQGCDAIRLSPYAWIGPVAVPLLGLLGYLTIFAFALSPLRFLYRFNISSPVIIFGLAIFGVLFSAYLAYIEFFVIYEVCYWCLASAVVIVLIFVASILAASKAKVNA